VLCAIFWQLFADISEKTIASILKSKWPKKNIRNRWIRFYTGSEMGGYWLSGKVKETAKFLECEVAKSTLCKVHTAAHSFKKFLKILQRNPT
jgi:riboflavin synthase alpha subunit